MKSGAVALLRVLRGETLHPPPIWLMRQAGRYLPEYRALRQSVGGFLDLCFQPEQAAEATLQPIRRFGFDAAILFSDILLVPKALGQALWFEVGEGPRLAPVKDRAAAEALTIDGIGARLAPVYAAARLVRERLPPSVALIGFAGAPWTVATYMAEGGASRDFAVIKAWAKEDPAGFAILIDRLVEATASHLIAQIEAGADAVQLFDTWAGSVEAEDFERLVIAPTQRIVARVQERHPRTPIIGFPRGIGALYRRYFEATGVDALSVDASVPCDVAASELQSIGPIQGNLDPKILLAGGAALDEAVTRILAALGEGPFIFNLGHGVVPETPPEHVARLIERVRQA
jgi:uroporphyrinogen decarboxylase